MGDDGIETEILLIACKSIVVDDFCREVVQAGFAVESVNAATILDYNTIQFAYPEMTDDVLLINIGARSTNLLFKNAEGFFVRNIQLGGHSLTQKLADRLGKPFARAEEIKHKFFAGDSDDLEDDSEAKLFRSCSDSFIRRIEQEISRSIVNYRHRRGAVAPQKLLLSGRGALLKGLAEQLSGSLKVQVEFFDPLRNVTLEDEIRVDSSALGPEIGEIIGRAARDMVTDGVSMNLLPEGVRRDMEFAAKKPFLLAAAIILAIAPCRPSLVTSN